MNYEAYDEVNDIEIYSGSSKNALIQELSEYIEYQNHIDENTISNKEIENLDRIALKRVGVIVYINQ